MEDQDIFQPKMMFLTKGTGRHKEKLSSFELALRSAGIEKYNLVRVSSIFPPGCKIISKEKGLGMLKTGQILFVVLAENSTNEPNRLLSASIGVAIPKNTEHYGYLSEHHSFGQSEKKCGEYAEDLAAQMLASTYGIKFNIDASYDEKKDIFKIDGRIVKTRHHTQSAVCGKDGLWTAVISAAVFIL
jgi:arginine decarboxylase